jgi:hypothetical protein
MELNRAVRDLEERTLASFTCELSKLLYLASTRDYSTGRYFHDGLANTFSYEIAERALESAHRKAFEMLVQAPLETIIQQVSEFVRATCADPKSVLETWKKLEPYRIAVPLDTNIAATALFVSNLRIAVEVLAARPDAVPPGLQSA